MRKPVFISIVLLFFSNFSFAQNSMVGDGFGGRGWYKPHNYQVGSYAAYTVCGDSNQLYGWGHNTFGELGNGSNTSVTTPVAATGMTNVKFYATGYVSAAIKMDSTAWAWGSEPGNESGFSNIPVQVLTNVKFADAGRTHAVFVKYDGTVWGVGTNNFGELGNGTTSSTPTIIPVQMTGITNAVRAIAIGGFIDSNECTVILLADGTVKITGGGGWFQENSSSIPVTMPGLNTIVDIKGNTFAAYALDADGNVFVFGKNRYASNSYLGTGEASNAITPPTKLNFPAGSASIVGISANADGYFAMALDSLHNAYSWGSNFYGQLGLNTTSITTTPTLIFGNTVDIFAGETFSYIIKTDTTLWCSGKSGSAGSIWMNLSNTQRNVFTQIDPTIPPMNLCVPIISGVLPVKLSNYTCVANNNNAVLNWQSAEETNAFAYIVEYSSDGRNFKSIATIPAKGSNNHYAYTHYIITGTAFYRLKMVDNDGRFQYSEIRTVKFDTQHSFTIAPNPAHDAVNLFIRNNSTVKSVQFVSVDGRVVKIINNYFSGEPINISKFSGGTYVVKIVYNNGELEYGRMIKN